MGAVSYLYTQQLEVESIDTSIDTHQRRENMTSHLSNYLDTLMTIEGQES